MERVAFRIFVDASGVHVMDEADALLAGEIELSPGGQIVFSTDVNAVLKDKQAFIRHAKRLMFTYWNRLTRSKRIDTTMVDMLKQRGIDSGWSIGNLYKGRYYSRVNDQLFNEKSLAVDIRGVPLEFVKEVALKLRTNFKQETVLVIDNSNGKSYLLD
jgi:hypothetical protein